MTLSPETLTAIKAACAAKAKLPVAENKVAIASYLKWLVDAPVAESSADLEETLQNPEAMREAVKTRESAALCLMLTSKGEALPASLAIEAAVEAKAFGFSGSLKVVQEALEAIQQVPTRFGYLVLSALTENDGLRKCFLDLAMEGSTALFYFTKPTAADKLKTEAERVLGAFGTVETLVKPGDVIGEGATSDLFVFAVTPTEAQQESVIGILIDGLVEAAIADSFSDISEIALCDLMGEALEFMNQTPPNGEVIGAEGEAGADAEIDHAEPDGDEDEEGEEPEKDAHETNSQTATTTDGEEAK
jgi:hypothetical protein